MCLLCSLLRVSEASMFLPIQRGFMKINGNKNVESLELCLQVGTPEKKKH